MLHFTTRIHTAISCPNPVLRRLTSLVLAFFLLANCSYVPFDRPAVSRAAVTGSEALPFADLPKRNGAGTFQTGIEPLRDGKAALHSRLQLMDEAHHTLDVSAFIIRPDHAGYLFADRLVKAANRGVKIRFLLDDLFNRSTAARFLPLDAHPNIEIRVFNPFSRFSPSAVGFLLDYDRVRRRMHSRMMVADNQTVILGGRNIADEYFSDNGTAAFNDFEILAHGRVAQQFSESFEIYWSDRWTLPLNRISNWDYASQYNAALKEISRRAKQARDIKYPRILGPELALLDRDRPPRFTAQTEFVSDVPDKLRQDQSGGPFHVAVSHFVSMALAKREVVIITPYFVPEEHGTRVLQALAARGVKVTIVTNSLASTNHTAVHGGYETYRDRLIRSGVRFHEMRVEADGGPESRDLQNTLHAKFTIIDGERTIVTTMNFDPVSIKGNLETSVVVRGRPFATWMLQRVNPVALDQTYRLSLDDAGTVVWLAPGNPGKPHKYADPGANLMRRIISLFSRILKLETML